MGVKYVLLCTRVCTVSPLSVNVEGRFLSRRVSGFVNFLLSSATTFSTSFSCMALILYILSGLFGPVFFISV